MYLLIQISLSYFSQKDILLIIAYINLLLLFYKFEITYLFKMTIKLMFSDVGV